MVGSGVRGLEASSLRCCSSTPRKDFEHNQCPLSALNVCGSLPVVILLYLFELFERLFVLL